MSQPSRNEPPGPWRKPSLFPVGAAAVLLVLACAAPWLYFGVVGALDSNTNDPRQWLPDGFAETARYRWFQQQFGSDEMTVVSWPGCTLGDERLEQLAAALLKDGSSAVFERAISGTQKVRELTAPPVELTRSEAIRRLRGFLVGPDGQTTCLILTLSARGVGQRPAAVERIREVAQQECGLPPDQLRLGGPTVDAATIDVESQRLLLELAALSGCVVLVITWLRIRSVRLAIIIMACAVYATAVALSILYYTGGNMNLVMTMLPPLVFVLSVSAAVHLVNYYRDAVQQGFGGRAAVRALACGWRPCALASGTTAVGLLSLAVSDIVPVKMFGIYSAAGIAASLLIVLTFLPAALLCWPAGAGSPAAAPTSVPRGSRGAAYVTWLCRRHAVVSLACLAVMASTAGGLPKLQSTVKLQYRFRADSRIIRDYRWLEQNIGPLVPLELVVRFSEDSGWDFLEQLQLVARVDWRLRGHEGVGAVLSGADLVPYLPRGGSWRNVARRTALRHHARDLLDGLRRTGYFAETGQHESLWRVSVRAPALGDLDYGRFVDRLQQDFDPALDEVPGVRLTYTGVIPLIYKAQRELLNDLVESFFLAFAVISLVMIAALRGLRRGLLTMIPNVFPAVTIFGLMGWLQIPIEIGSIMTASAAMGIAVDDTFHFLTWFRRGVDEQQSRPDALRFSFRRCAGAMMLTTLVCALGILVFSLSSFMPIVRFAWLMATLLVAALVGDLVLLPSLLAGPAGRLFTSRPER